VQSYYDLTILSPHLDDGVLSCGGQAFMAAAAGKSVLIATVMAADPPPMTMSAYAQSLHDRWQLNSETAAHRREEDVHACRILGADYWHWPFPDCIYRTDSLTDEAFYQSDDDIFGPLHEGDMDLVTEIRGYLQKLPPFGKLLVPLTTGNHVDHQLVRLAVENAVEKGRLDYYEEYPYVMTPGALDKVLSGSSYLSRTIQLSPAAVTRKIEAIAAYDSQLSTFFEGLEDLDRQVRGYIKAVGGERIWQFCGGD